jgi:putative ABC transport system permease protein
MMLWMATGQAFRAIAVNKLRSVLTALGIVIGVGAVIGMVHLGESAKTAVTEQIASLGDNLLMVTPGAGDRGPGGTRTSGRAFEIADAEAIGREVAGVTVAPTSSQGALSVVGNTNWPTMVTGVDNRFFAVRDWEIATGRPFEPGELQAAAPVCVLGATVVKELFAGQDALGASVRVGKVACRVVGTLASKQSMMGSDPDDVILMPLRTVQRRLAGNTEVKMIYVTALEDGSTGRVKEDIEALLRERRRIKAGDADDFSVRDMKEIADRVQGSTEVLTALLGAIAAVSLLVGGIGIMNIMLVSVTERTREIGIRMAVGARGREVLLQFLVESVVLATLGGILGIGLGLGGSYLAASKLGMPFVVIPTIVSLAFFFSAGVGVVFGFVPARKASRLDPIEALRHE